MIIDDKRLIYNHEIKIDTIRLIKNNIINDIVNIINTKTISIQIVWPCWNQSVNAINKVKLVPIIFCKQISYSESITLLPNLDRIQTSL